VHKTHLACIAWDSYQKFVSGSDFNQMNKTLLGEHCKILKILSLNVKQIFLLNGTLLAIGFWGTFMIIYKKIP